MPEGCAIVTGGSRGIGAAIARALSEDGWPVAVTYRSGAEAAQAVVADLERGVAVQGDVADPASADAVHAAATEALGGPVLVLVNNAGITRDNVSTGLKDDDWDDVLATNLSGAFRMTRKVLRPMVKARFGRVVNVASIVGLRANPGQANYAAAKAGLVGMTKTVAAEVAHRGVTVNAVAPGLIDTDMTGDGVGETLLQHVPAKRAGTPEEVAACVRFLVSEDAGYVTGTTLTVDGGLSA
jgi:3-oxoacyl-[acyl-carrier protein] reductase